MQDIHQLTDDQLREELERRKAATLPVPRPVANPDFGPLVKMIVEGHERTIRDGYEDDDLDHYVFEAAVTAVFGSEYWAWRRQQKW